MPTTPMTEETFNFESPEEHYEAEAFILWCFDWRFDPLLDEFKKRYAKPDYVKWAGGAKALAGDGPDKAAVLNQIKLSAGLHHPKTVVLMEHADCGAYGAYETPDAEFRGHSENLKRAAEAVKADPDLADMEVECWFADFKGARRIL